MKIQLIDHRNPLLADVMIMGKQNAKTLGLFPKDAYIDHARKKFIYGAIEDNKLIGFVLFRITVSKQMVFITQLCISDQHRNTGVARLLLDQLKLKYGKILNGIGLSCRRDYEEATKLWEKYGFKALKQTRSRSKEERFLIKWYYDFGNRNLFSISDQAGYKIQALLDSNIVMKLSDDPTSTNREAFALCADWLIDETEYFYAPEIFNEILRDTELDRAEETRKFLHTLNVIQFDPTLRDTLSANLALILPGHSENDKSDRMQLAECIAGGIEYFITLDKKLLDKSDLIFETYSVRVLRPAEFIMFIDHNNRPNDYRSLRFAGANYESGKLTREGLEELTAQQWLHPEISEKKHSLLKSITDVISDIRSSTIRYVKDNNGNYFGYFAAKWDQTSITVSIIRVIKNRLSEVLLQQLIKDIIQLGVEKNTLIIKIEEPFLTNEQTRIVESFGFRLQNGFYSKIILKGLWDSCSLFTSNVLARKQLNIGDLDQELKNLTVEESDMIKLALEKQLFPVKFEDISIPTYIIPIKPYWASQLFDHIIADHSLFGAKAELTWNRENVYYRNVNPVTEVTPGRILWYVSSAQRTKTGRESSIVACSYLEEIHIGAAKILYRKFKNYGIYEWKDILELTNGQSEKEIKALKFIDTEVFKKAVTLPEIQQIFIKNGRPANTFASPVKISKEIFNSIYKLLNR